jgi:hypothetical protein
MVRKHYVLLLRILRLRFYLVVKEFGTFDETYWSAYSFLSVLLSFAS